MTRILSMLFLCVSAQAATWYVRTPGTVYGANNGTSYADAWTGATNITWSSIASGDTIICAGYWILTATHGIDYLSIGIASIGTNSVTIRGDYPSDTYTNFGGVIDGVNTPTWNGPDGNGVYWTTNTVIGAFPRQIHYQLVSGIPVWLTTKTNTTWSGDLGACMFDGVTNFVKTLDGSSPSGKTFPVTGGGFQWNINSKTNVTFINCHFIDTSIQQNGSGWVPAQPGYSNGAKYLTFDGCQSVYGGSFRPFAGNDYLSFLNCEIAFSDYGIYSIIRGGDTRGANNLTISNCIIHDISITRAGNNQDDHGIGCQGGSSWTVVGNTLTNTGGTAIDFYSFGFSMTNNVIAGNFLQDIHGTINSGTGIAIDSGSPAIGTQVGLSIYNNVINRVGVNGQYSRTGIGVNTADLVKIWNNTIQYCERGIFVSSGSNPLNVDIRNNIISSPTNTFIQTSGTSLGSVVCDYNMCYSNGTAPVFSISPSFTHDTHSSFGNPLFASNPQTIASNFKIQNGSAALYRGTAVGLATDFSGVSYHNPPSIGAFEFVQGSKVAKATNLHIKNLFIGP